MAASKRTKPRRPVKPAETTGAPTAADFSVILEDLHGKFAVFGEALQGIRESMVQGFQQIDRRFEHIESELGTVKGDVACLKGDVACLKGDVACLKGDVACLKGDVACLKGDVAFLKTAVLDDARETKALRGSVDTLAEKIEMVAERAQ